MTDDAKAKPKLNMIGQAEPKRERPMEPFQVDRPIGERLDGAGAGPHHADRHDAVPGGCTARRRAGGAIDAPSRPEEPDAACRGQPESFTNGTPAGSGSGSGGAGTGAVEEPDPDSAGGGREHGFAADRKLPDRRQQ